MALLSFLSLSLLVCSVWAYDNSRSDNLVVYYGQNSYGATHSDTGNFQQRLSFYCQDDVINVFPLAFLHVFFGPGGLPEINLANTCNNVDNSVFPGTGLPNCQFMEQDIKTCQSKGKIVTLSLGGATGAASFSSDAQAEQFADTVWNLFLGGSSSTRPFGNAVLDGVDLDIEGGSSTGFAAFVRRIRSHANGASKPYYVTAAPQCPFPDAYLSPILNAVGVDAVYVQFYNNYCSVASPGSFNFGDWDNWARTQAPNKNVKIYIGAPASQTAAGSGYVDANSLINLARQTKSQYSSFGGVMLWDASQAYANGRFDRAVKNGIAGGTGATTPTTTRTTATTTTRTTTTTRGGGSGGCSGVAAWSSAVAYTGGSQVTYNGHLWTAKWWTQADTPGGGAGVWTDNGACFAGEASTEPAQVSSTPAAEVTVLSSSFESVTASVVESKVTAADAEATSAVDSDNSSETQTNIPRRVSRFFRL
ncbi:glycoside hydrolase family 18 protein [Moniliophthora roreri]|nr:glycoside hydrolase family 18 protein [Moniliophthora roreri]